MEPYARRAAARRTARGFRESQEAGLAAMIDLARPEEDIRVNPPRPSLTALPVPRARPEAAPVVSAGSAAAETSAELPAIAHRRVGPSRPVIGYGSRLIVFSTIGGSFFLMGFVLQALLPSRWNVLPWLSYLIQAVVSVETSFLLNRWITWRDRKASFWATYVKFNAQKTVTIILNLAFYASLLRLGVNYLVANVVLTAVFTLVNYTAGDRLVFVPGRKRLIQPDDSPTLTLMRDHPLPDVSVIIPCRENEQTIRATVQSLIDQEYPHLCEIILIGSSGDRTWDGLIGISDPRLTIMEVEAPPGLRDANFKRNAGIEHSGAELIALVDSDIVLPRDWLSQAVAALDETGVSCVTGGMMSI